MCVKEQQQLFTNALGMMAGRITGGGRHPPSEASADSGGTCSDAVVRDLLICLVNLMSIIAIVTLILALHLTRTATPPDVKAPWCHHPTVGAANADPLAAKWAELERWDSWR